MTNQVPKLWIFFFFIVVALLIGLALSEPAAQVEEEVGQSQEMEEVRAQTFQGMLERGDNAVYVENQAAGAKGVQVGYVVLNQPGYVAILNDDGGVPGVVIGVSELLETGGEHLTVFLDDPLQDGAVYYAILYHDNGDGVFQANQDTHALDLVDSVVLMTFLATTSAEVETGAVMP